MNQENTWYGNYYKLGMKLVLSQIPIDKQNIIQGLHYIINWLYIDMYNCDPKAMVCF
jgi:hypothetical protein